MTRTTSTVLALVAVLLAVVGAHGTARADLAPQAALRVELSMAEGPSYDHDDGGGIWGDGPGGAGVDVWDEQQWPPDFACGDIVSFMLLVTSDSTTGVGDAPRTVEVDLVFDAATNGKPGAGYSHIVGVSVQHDDPGAKTDGASTAGIVAEHLEGLHEPEGELTGTIEVTDIEVGERIVVRVDVLASCSSEPYSGILYAQFDQKGLGQSGFREMSPDGPRDLGAGQNQVQMIQVNGPGEPTTTTTTTTTSTTTTTTTEPGPDVEEEDEGDPGLTLDKQQVGSVVDVDGSGTTNAGDRVDYRLVVTNVGDEVLTGAVVVDPKPGTTTPDCPASRRAPWPSGPPPRAR